jgi:spore coat polysaccharide biosynthesis protein SpsF
VAKRKKDNGMIAAIIQARMTSSRLPGKVLKKILGRPLLSYLIERLNYCSSLEEIIIATTTNIGDEPIVNFAVNNNLACYRGSENDVLDRYYQAAKKFGVNHIVRITSDCPLIDPQVVDKIIGIYSKHSDSDLTRTGPTYPEGLDVEVFPFKNLEIAWREAQLSSEREHVTPLIWKNPTRFNIHTIPLEEDYSFLRLTVDEYVDFEVVKAVIEEIYKKDDNPFLLKDVINLYEEKPHIFDKNKHVARNEGYLKSVKNDSIFE